MWIHSARRSFLLVRALCSPTPTLCPHSSAAGRPPCRYCWAGWRLRRRWAAARTGWRGTRQPRRCWRLPSTTWPAVCWPRAASSRRSGGAGGLLAGRGRAGARRGRRAARQAHSMRRRPSPFSAPKKLGLAPPPRLTTLQSKHAPSPQPHLPVGAGRQNLLHRRAAGHALWQAGVLHRVHRRPGRHDGGCGWGSAARLAQLEPGQPCPPARRVLCSRGCAAPPPPLLRAARAALACWEPQRAVWALASNRCCQPACLPCPADH